MDFTVHSTRRSYIRLATCNGNFNVKCERCLFRMKFPDRPFQKFRSLCKGRMHRTATTVLGSWLLTQPCTVAVASARQSGVENFSFLVAVDRELVAPIKEGHRRAIEEMMRFFGEEVRTTGDKTTPHPSRKPQHQAF